MIIGISGKMQSGKDTVALMWNYITWSYRYNYTISTQGFNKWSVDIYEHPWQIRYFAGKLREFVSSITGISVEDLMKDEVKNTIIPSFNKTPRQLLQLIGTEVCRVVDPDFHIIALMNNYKLDVSYMCDTCGAEDIRELYEIDTCPRCYYHSESNLTKVISTPNWLIADIRFPNELKAIEDREGVVIRVERSWENRHPKLWKQYNLDKTDRTNGFLNWLSYEDGFSYFKHTHPSETSLDNHEFKYIIDNNGTLEQLLNKVKLVYDLINKKEGTNIILEEDVKPRY